MHLVEESQPVLHLHLPARFRLPTGRSRRAHRGHVLPRLPIFAFGLDHVVHQLILIVIFSLKCVLLEHRGCWNHVCLFSTEHGAELIVSTQYLLINEQMSVWLTIHGYILV